MGPNYGNGNMIQHYHKAIRVGKNCIFTKKFSECNKTKKTIHQ